MLITLERFMLKARFKKISKNSSGFTLIEILITIAIIGLLVKLSVTAIQPGRRIKQARNTKRETNVNTILTALGRYQAVNDGDLSGLGLNGLIADKYYLLGEGDLIICGGVSCNGGFAVEADKDCLDLSSGLADYLDKMPIEPLKESGYLAVGGAKVWSKDVTGYTLKKSANNLITIRACNAEDPEGGSAYPTIQAFYNFY